MQDHNLAMQELHDIDLRTDAAARWYVKHEQVQVRFATQEGELVSREGPNRYRAGDALITGSTGDQWGVSRGRFDARYAPVELGREGGDGLYINRPIPVLARCMTAPFALARSAGGDVLRGKPGDWVLQYAPGDYGVVEQERFAKVYRPSDAPV